MWNGLKVLRKGKDARFLIVSIAALLLAVGFAGTACGDGDDSGTPDAGATAGEQELETVRIAITPFFEYQPWVIAHERGLDREQGLNFEFTNVTKIEDPAIALRRGEIDVGPSCHTCTLNFLKELPELRDWMPTNQFKGFIVVGRKGQTDTFDELQESVGPEQAKERLLRSFEGKTFVLHAAVLRPLLDSALSQAGLTADDVKIIDFPTDAQGGLAYIGGTGDYYMGSLPQEAKMLYGSPDEFVNVGGHDLLGPAAVFYSTMIANESWLAENHDTAMKLLAVWYRTMKYLDERPEEILPRFTELMNERTASNFTEEQVGFIVTTLEDFMTLERAKLQTYNASSDLYWQRSVDEYVSKAETLPDDFSVGKYLPNEEFFDNFLQEAELVRWVESPLE